LEKLFRTYNSLDLKTIINFLEDDYTEWEIINSIKKLISPEEKIYYKDYLKIYSEKSSIQKIINKITKIFRRSFKSNFKTIQKECANYTDFEIITALKKIIDENIVIKNKYGFSSYLREYNNIYFLINNLSIQINSFSGYYVEYPNIIKGESWDSLFSSFQMKLLPNFIESIFKVKTMSKFSNLIKSVPEEIQELLIESAIIANNQKINKNKITQQFILDYFSNYIFNIEGIWISSRLEDKDILRCLEEGKDVWTNCSNKYKILLEEYIQNRKSKLEDNPFGYST